MLQNTTYFLFTPKMINAICIINIYININFQFILMYIFFLFYKIFIKLYIWKLNEEEKHEIFMIQQLILNRIFVQKI